MYLMRAQAGPNAGLHNGLRFVEITPLIVRANCKWQQPAPFHASIAILQLDNVLPESGRSIGNEHPQRHPAKTSCKDIQKTSKRDGKRKLSRESIKSWKNSTHGSYLLLADCGIITGLDLVIQNTFEARERNVHGN
jgi:hypothetical protein